jgi:hypothetical protein
MISPLFNCSGFLFGGKHEFPIVKLKFFILNLVKKKICEFSREIKKVNPSLSENTFLRSFPIPQTNYAGIKNRAEK